LISTTAGSIFAMAASCCASNVVPLDDVAVAVATALDVVLVLLLLFVNCRPANRPTPKMRTSTKARSRIAPPRPGRLGGGADSGPEGDLGGGCDASCSGGVCVTGGVSKSLFEKVRKQPVDGPSTESWRCKSSLRYFQEGLHSPCQAVDIG